MRTSDQPLDPALPNYIQPPADSIERLPSELKGEIVKWASLLGAEKAVTLASLRLLSHEYCYYATPYLFEVSSPPSL